MARPAKNAVKMENTKLISGFLMYLWNGRSVARSLLAPDQFPLLGHGSLHQEDKQHQSHAQDGEQPEDVEVGERRGLLLAEVVQRLERHLLRPGRVARLLHEVGPASI